MARGESHLAARLSYFVGIFLLLFAGFATLAWRTLDQVRVNGPIYDEIIQGNNLIADILPPPQYIIESYLLVLRLKDESDPAEIARLIEKGNALRVGYENGQETWKRQLADGELRNMMTVTAARAAMDFYRLRDDEYLPALKAGERDRALAVLQRMHQRYEAHRFAIAFHRQRRTKAMTESVLDGIPGLGPSRRAALLAHFGSVRKLRAATPEQLRDVPGIGPALADAIVVALARDSASTPVSVNVTTGEVLD